jgi:(p)ppGpp synthase/HD superfamily hydrolase
MTLKEKALKFATEAHAGQVRKFTGEPYITHPIAVAEITLRNCNWGGNASFYRNIKDSLYIIAILHDTLEDCASVTKEILVKEFGQDIADSVDALTKRPSETYLDSILRAVDDRFAIYVKIADLTHNMSDLKEGTLKDKYRLALYILKDLSY